MFTAMDNCHLMFLICLKTHKKKANKYISNVRIENIAGSSPA